jgi:hypothetical protein
VLETAHGYILSPFAGTELNGRMCHQYQAPDEASTDTVRLTVTMEEPGK